MGTQGADPSLNPRGGSGRGQLARLPAWRRPQMSPAQSNKHTIVEAEILQLFIMQQ